MEVLENKKNLQGFFFFTPPIMILLTTLYCLGGVVMFDFMYDFLNKISFHNREILIDYGQLARTLKILDEFNITWKRKVHMGNCCWGKAPKCWFITMKISDYEWHKVLKRFKEEHITILPPYTGY